MQDHNPQTAEFAVPGAEAGAPDWLEEARSLLSGAGHHLALREEGSAIQVFEIQPGWTRIGRSATADIRLEDPSVSRRHALIVWEPPKKLKVLDDRSLNGIMLNGDLVEWAALADGDELAIGRYRLFTLQG